MHLFVRISNLKIKQSDQDFIFQIDAWTLADEHIQIFGANGQRYSLSTAWKDVTAFEKLTDVRNFYYLIVIQKTRTVRVRVPYPHCTGAARTQIVDSMDTNTLRDTQKILKKNFFLNFSDLHAYIYLIFFQI